MIGDKQRLAPTVIVHSGPHSKKYSPISPPATLIDDDDDDDEIEKI